MPYDDYGTLRVEVDAGVALVTLDHPPINLLDGALIADLVRLRPEVEADEAVRVIVFRSAVPDFFIAHADVTLIQRMPQVTQPARRGSELSQFHAFVEGWRTLPKVTIAQLEGCARGGGSEFALSLDMRFGAIGRAVVGQPEVALGILPGGSGTQRLPRLMGRSRALEAVLGCADFDAELAERYGWINRALPPDEIEAFVDRLARRIAAFPPEAVALAKASVDAASGSPVEGLIEEQYAFDQTLGLPASARLMQRFMELGGQTPEVERDLDALLDQLVR